MNYYVYYKVPSDRTEALRAQVHGLFKLVREKFGVDGRWMHRRDDPATYMEVYEGVGEENEELAAFEALLEREGAKLGVQRKVERFVSA